MWSYHPDLLAKPVPRYTSYPTAMEFADDVGADDQARALDAVESATPVSLDVPRSEEHTSELQSLMRISYSAFCLKTERHRNRTPYTLPHLHTTQSDRHV